MNYFLFIFKSSISDLFKNKLRSFLTGLGIVIGVASVVLLLAFGFGLKNYINEQLNNLGSNLVFVFPGQIFNQNTGFAALKSSVTFEEKDLLNLKKLKLAEAVVPVFRKPSLFKACGKEEVGMIYGTTDEIFPVRNLVAQYGEVFKKAHLSKKVAVLGPEIARKLYGSEAEAIDKKIKIEEQTFKVIGVLKAKGGVGFGGPNFDTFVYIPYKTIFNITGKKNFTAFLLKARSESEVDNLKKEAEKMMLKSYKKDDFTTADAREVLDTIQSIFSVLNMVLVGIGTISLIVGGIGIMNIMYVSVTERTREIGIRRAIGAWEKDILYQFLSESVILSLLGGIIGLLVSYLVVYFIRRFFPAEINLISVALAVSVSSIIGIVFGVFPARKAAKLSPVDAIRYE